MIQDLRLTSFSVSSVVNKKVVQEVEQTNILDKYQGLLDTLNKHQEEEEGEIKDHSHPLSDGQKEYFMKQ